MELHTRVELIDTLREEANQKMQALHHALAAQERAKEEIQHAGHDTPLSQEGATLKYEQDKWLRVLATTERTQVNQRIRHQLHPVVSLLNTFKAEQQPLELVLPGKGPLDPQA